MENLLRSRGNVFQKATAESEVLSRASLAARLNAVFTATPVEDGIRHPGETVIQEALQAANKEQVLPWLKAFALDANQPHFAASVLQCLSVLQHPGTVAWRVALIREALTMDDVGIRDAAAQAAECWGGAEMLDVLQKHADPVPWLQAYILDVCKDLEG